VHIPTQIGAKQYESQKFVANNSPNGELYATNFYNKISCENL
jgi:hypothetical protein